MYLVTGATGTVGRPLVRLLVAAGVPVRVTTRRPASTALPGSVEVVPHARGRLPLTGVTAVFVNATALGLFDGPSGTGGLATILARARAAGARRVVLLSSSSALDDGSPVGERHRTLERQVQHSGLAWAVLRPGMFASNTAHWAPQIHHRGAVRGAFGDALIAPIDPRDVASVAACALLAPDDDPVLGSAHVLSGPEQLTARDQLAVLARRLGRTLVWEDVPAATMRRTLVDAGEPAWAAEGLVRYSERAAAEPVPVSAATAQITGSPGRRFAHWAEDHADAFAVATGQQQRGERSDAATTAPA